MAETTDRDGEADGRDAGRGAPPSPLRVLVQALVVVVGVTLAWYGWGRLQAEGRALRVVRDAPVASPAAGGEAAGADSTPRTVRVLTWNLAHGRGTAGYGLLRNFRGGGEAARRTRLRRIAEVIRDQDADVVVLNEVDFSATWSHGVNHAALLGEWAAYPHRVQQANYDLRLPFFEVHFGNALLSRLPVRDARPVALPPHHRIEPWLLGAKSAAVVRLATPAGPLAVVPIHLEARAPGTRQAALPVLRRVAGAEAAPLVLAGDFNASPPSWPDPIQRVGIGQGSPEGGADGGSPPAGTVIGGVLEAGFRSPRARGGTGPSQWTYPTFDPDRAIDWVFAEPPLHVVEARVLRGPAVDSLSDHRPVLSVVRLPASRPDAADATGGGP